MTTVLSMLRWKQWTKNLLIVAPFFAAGSSQTAILMDLLVGVVAFSFLSSAIYILNDLKDVDEDRRHPIKSRRPIAAGKISRSFALVVSVILTLISSLLVLVLLNGRGLIWFLTYFATSVLYVYLFRSVFLLDLYFLSAGFVFRVLFGGDVAGIPISSWLLVVIGSFAFFIVSGKRYSEIVTGNSSLSGRHTLSLYSIDYLKQVLFCSLTLTIVSYSLWTIEGVTNDSIAFVSLIPFSFIMLRYLFDVLNGVAEAPEIVLFGDRAIQIALAIWALTYWLRFV